MATSERCGGITAAGQPCRRPPTRGTSYCLAHDPDRRDEHAEVSRLGGVARHDPETLGLKAEVRELMMAMRSGEVSAGVGSVLLQAIRLLRELEADERLNDTGDRLIESIQALRASSPPDLSEPANDPPGGLPSWSDEAPEPHDPDAPDMEDYRRPDGTIDGDAYLADSRAHKAVPLSHLTIEQRRKRFASNRRA